MLFSGLGQTATALSKSASVFSDGGAQHSLALGCLIEQLATAQRCVGELHKEVAGFLIVLLSVVDLCLLMDVLR